MTHRLLRLRMRSQLLAGRRPADVPAAVSAVLAVQAQAAAPARLAVRARTRGLVAADVDAAVAARSVVRTWLMRGTLHMVAAADVRWLVGLLGPVFAAAGRRRRLELGLDDGTGERALDAIAGALAGSPPLTRADLMRAIGREATGQAPAHLVAYAAMRGLICRGPEAAKDEPTYVLLDDWVPAAAAPVPTGDDALALLARRYLSAYGPARPEDFQSWSGLPMPRARHAFALLEPELSEVDGLPVLSTIDLRDRGGPPVARLLGHFDPYLLGFRSRDLILDPRFARRIQAGGGMIQPSVVLDGQVVGTWRQRRSAGRVTVTVEPFAGVPSDSAPLLDAEAADVARFLGVPASGADRAG